MLDIKGNSTNIIAARLSNFTARKFLFRDVLCTGIESLLQSLKIANPKKQACLCQMGSRGAQKRGQEHNDWKDTQILWWGGDPYPRNSKEYLRLITEIYDTVYEQDPGFAQDLLATEMQDICHSIGKSDPQDTVLTEVEMIYQLNRLRIRAHRDIQ